jgi:undecaprenyl-diphosphatase
MLLSILPPFREELARERKMIVLLVLASIPAAIVGFSPLKGVFEGTYESPSVVGLLLMVTGGILFLPRLITKRQKERGDVGFKSALMMGIGQAFAILPGVSRSGSSIVSGMLAGAKSSAAAEFSFLMAIPAIAAAAFLELDHLPREKDLLTNYMAGAGVAFGSGLIAIYTVLASIRRGKFEYFGIYCLIAGASAFLYFQFIAT